VAVLVTVAAFGAVTWMSGTFVLQLRDGGVRWGIAGGLGVAVAALAALWGHSYATAEPEPREAEKTHAAPTSTEQTTNTIMGGTFHGSVIQGHDIRAFNLADPVSAESTQAMPPLADDPPAEG
jgi:hypothetical protein